MAVSRSSLSEVFATDIEFVPWGHVGVIVVHRPTDMAAGCNTYRTREQNRACALERLKWLVPFVASATGNR